MTLFGLVLFKTIIYIRHPIMTKRTLSNKTRISILRLSGFRARMATKKGQRIIKNRRKKGRKKLAINC